MDDKLQIEELERIKTLWQTLNHLHGELCPDFQHYFRHFDFASRKRELLSKAQIKCWLARDDEQNIGYCIASIDQQQGEIESIYIDEAYRSCDLGTQLMQQAVGWLQHEACDKIRVAVAAGNEAVLPFYAQFGFRPRLTVLEIPQAHD